ncbi:MAG TPA: hypothetical protein VMV38_00675 [Candidatus Paceibacterota bacterium]|nr:hypothetical protein [Candidatus Paceibacterota bacterium]
MNQDEESVPLARNDKGRNRERSLTGYLLSAIVAICTLLAVPAPHAAEMQLRIRITPRAAALIAEQQRKVAPTVTPASSSAPSSNTVFTKSCNATGGSIAKSTTGLKQLVCV